MSNRFEHIFECATANKKQFDESVSSVRDALQDSLKGTVQAPVYTKPAENRMGSGWLRGALSYPWAIVCIIIPAVLDMM